MLTATAAISLTEPYAVRGQESARGLQVWAHLDDVDLQIVDDVNSPAVAVGAYRHRISQKVAILLGLLQERSDTSRVPPCHRSGPGCCGTTAAPRMISPDPVWCRWRLPPRPISMASMCGMRAIQSCPTGNP